MAFIGKSVPRLEDRPLVTGRGAYAADISFAHQLHMRVVRSAVAHGRIIAVETSAARALPGVVAVWTSSDVADIPPIDFRLSPIEGLAAYRQPILARDRVRYVGEPVAAVFATDAYVAEDAAELVTLEIEELPPVLTAQGPPGEFEPGRSTEAAVIEKHYGDVEQAFREAHAVVELALDIGRHSGVPIETRGAIAVYDASRDILEMYGAAKVPHWNRDNIARMLGRAPSSVHLHEGHVGGGFGIRGELYPEDVLVCLAALRLDVPVKWIEDRREHLIAANHSRQQRHHIRAAVTRDGCILALDDEFFHDQGGYVRTHAATVPDLAATMLPGPYQVPAYRATGRIRLTNKTPCGTYRAPGRYESTFARERMIDAIAARLGLDPIEVRRRNLIDASEFPYARPFATLGTDVVLDSGDYARLLDKALAAVGWDRLQADLHRRRTAGEAVGAGLAMFVEKSGLGPFDAVHVSVDRAGAVEMITGAASVGQGVETVLAQICADSLGVDYKGVRVVHGQTDRIAFGVGAFASRVTVMTGEAVRRAAVEVRTKALELAAALLQKSADRLDIVGGNVVTQDRSAGPSITLAEIARALEPTSKLRGEREPGLAADGWFFSDRMNYPYGVHIAVVRVDRDTGGVAVERYFVAYDIGKAVNPMLVEGQIAGGFAQGLGGALLEEFHYDARGEPLAVNFADYLMPTAREIPMLEVIITEDAPSPLNPLGLKGAGEAGVNAVGAAIASAIDAAIGIPGAVTQLPVTPQRMRQILRGASTVPDASALVISTAARAGPRCPSSTPPSGPAIAPAPFPAHRRGPTPAQRNECSARRAAPTALPFSNPQWCSPSAPR
jgi:carbon-monoxide dehydrogenase large subunit/6-hydroxypseudooxynicotine dehydrogenase subunit gamma